MHSPAAGSSAMTRESFRVDKCGGPGKNEERGQLLGRPISFTKKMQQSESAWPLTHAALHPNLHLLYGCAYAAPAATSGALPAYGLRPRFSCPPCATACKPPTRAPPSVTLLSPPAGGGPASGDAAGKSAKNKKKRVRRKAAAKQKGECVPLVSAPPPAQDRTRVRQRSTCTCALGLCAV